MRCRNLILPALLALLSCIGLAHAQAARTQVELVDTFPSGREITLPAGKTVYLRIAYDAEAPVRIWPRPYFQGQEVPAGTNGSLEHSGKGETLGFFFLPEGGQVDEIRVTAGDGSRGGTVEVARWPLRVYSYRNATPVAQAEPPWVATLRASEDAQRQAEMQARMDRPETGADIAIFGGFAMAFALVGVAGLAWPAWAVWRWRDRWRRWAMLPLAVLGLVVLNILAGTAIDPTSHNLWPFEIVMWGIPCLLAMAVIAALRRREQRRAG